MKTLAACPQQAVVGSVTDEGMLELQRARPIGGASQHEPRVEKRSKRLLEP